MKYRDCSLAVLAMAIAGPAWAQQKPVESSELGTLTEVVVTAQRTSTNLQNTPIAVTAINGETLRAQGATSLLDVQNAAPSLVISSRSSAGIGQGGFTIRGIGVDATGSSSAVGLYVDEVYYPSSSGNILGLFDVDRVEVLRGPQGTLFGRNTIAGAVQYITNAPRPGLGGFVEAAYGNLDHRELSSALNLPLGDTLIRASGRYNRDGGYVYDILNDVDRGETVTKQGRLQVRWTPSSRLTINLKGEILDFEGNGRAIELQGFNRSLTPPGSPGGGASLIFAAIGSGLDPASIFGVTPSGKDYRFAGFNAPDRQDFSFKTAQANIAFDVTDTIVFKSISAYSESKDHELSDIDNTVLPIVGANKGDFATKLFTQELQMAGRALEDRLHFTLGAYLFDSVDDKRNEAVTFGASPLVILAYGGDRRNKVLAKAAYVQGSYDLTERLSATVGLRYSHEDVTGSFLNAQYPNTANPAQPIVAPAPFAPYKTSFEDWSPHLGVNFQATPDLLVYGTVSKGFRAGGVSVNGNLVNPAPPAPAITTTPGYAPFSPETAWTYELGVRLQALDRRLRFNPTVFYTDWKSIQFNDFVFNPTPQIISRNAGDARIWGVELETQALVTSRLQLTGSFSYLNAEYTRIAPGIDVSLDSDLQHSPKFKVSVGARYSVPLKNGDRLLASALYAWTDDQRSAVSNSDAIVQPSYGLLNVLLQYNLERKNISVSLYANNLLNEYYYIGGVNGSATFGSIEADPGRPREYGLRLRYDF